MSRATHPGETPRFDRELMSPDYFEGDCVQLEGDRENSRTVAIEVDDIRVRVFRNGPPYLFREIYRSPDFHFALLLAAPQPFLYDGRPLEPGDGLQYLTGPTYNCRMGAGCLTLDVHAPARTAVLRGWHFGSDILRAVTPRWFEPLARHAAALLRADPPTAAARDELFRLAVTMLDEARFRPVLRNPANARHHRIVMRALRIIDRSDELAIPGIPALADTLGVGPDELVAAFRREVGICPIRYRFHRRLSWLHKTFVARDPRYPDLARAAAAAGFDDLAAVEREYRHAFGESPAETLA